MDVRDSTELGLIHDTMLLPSIIPGIKGAGSTAVIFQMELCVHIGIAWIAFLTSDTIAIKNRISPIILF